LDKDMNLQKDDKIIKQELEQYMENKIHLRILGKPKTISIKTESLSASIAMYINTW